MFSHQFLNQLEFMADHLSQKEYWSIENIFDAPAFDSIKNEFEKNLQNFKPAQIGKGELKTDKPLIRNDLNFWLSNNEINFKPIWDLLDSIQNQLKSKLYLPIKRYDAQLAHYPPGHFYKRHSDKHKLMPSRLLTLVYYMSDWHDKAEGELLIYSKDTITVQPKANSLVLFFSEIEHEVLPTKAHRKSLTAWFRDDIL